MSDLSRVLAYRAIGGALAGAIIVASTAPSAGGRHQRKRPDAVPAA